jgi:hypothetical protein
MKALLLSTALAAIVAMPAVAQDAPASPFQLDATGPAVPASDLIGARIYASDAAIDAEGYAGVQDGWSDIGEVNDIILGRDGTVDAVLVDIGGFLGIGERQVAVDMAALRFVSDDATDADDWFLVLQADRATLEGAPEWTMSAVRTDATTTDDAESVPVVDEAVTTEAEGAPGTMEDPNAAATLTEDPMTEGQIADGTVAVSSENEPAMALPEGYAAVEGNTLTAEMLTGANVRDASDASIAEVSDLVLSPEGQVTHVVLDVGGFLGIGAKSVALPMEELTVAQRDGAVLVWVGLSREELEALPEHSM